MNEMIILHLSDIHFKKHSRDENKTFRKDVQTKMTDAIKEHIKKYMAPDVVAVTGDISFSGKSPVNGTLKFGFR